jgi:hypothetical protein
MRHPSPRPSSNGSKPRLVIAAIRVCLAFRRRVEPIRNYIEQRPRDLLREQVDLPRDRIKRPFQRDIEALFLSTRAVIGETETFLDERVDINRPSAQRRCIERLRSAQSGPLIERLTSRAVSGSHGQNSQYRMQ